mmetsp:Transcript_6836/g.7861  ORF Transcript_6836/g.7861 Transcript_6836/m.7861 type:complete len:84 (+) Transcript_6836:2-253(+)
MVWSASYNEGLPPCTTENGCVTPLKPVVRLQRDGNMVVYSNNGEVLWIVRTKDRDDSSITVTDDGSVFMTQNGIKVWSVPVTP